MFVLQMALQFLSSVVCVLTDCISFVNTFVLLIMTDFATLSRLDLEILDTQQKIKYVRLPASRPRKSDLWLTQTKGIRTNTNRGKINTKHADLV